MRNAFIVVIQKPPNAVDTASSAILFHCVNFSRRVRCYPHGRRYSERFRRPLQIFPNRLSCAMFIHIKSMFKHPHRPRLPPQGSQKSRVKSHFQPLVCFFLRDCHSLCEFGSSEVQNVRHTQAATKCNEHNKAVLSGQSGKNMGYNVLVHIVRFYDIYPLSVPVCRRRRQFTMRKMSNPCARKKRAQGFERNQKRNVKQYFHFSKHIFDCQ